MPLDRENLTGPSKIMLPLYTTFYLVVGVSYLATPVARLRETPTLRYADGLFGVPLHGWAFMFLACGVLMALAGVFRSTRSARVYMRFALLFGGTIVAGWTGLNVAAAFDGAASYSAWAWPAVIAGACYASYRSLTYRPKPSPRVE